jgi:hypothetical protein
MSCQRLSLLIWSPFLAAGMQCGRNSSSTPLPRLSPLLPQILTVTGTAPPPRDPNDDDDDEVEDEEDEDQPDEPAVVREPDED